MKPTDRDPAPYLHLPFAGLLTHWRVDERGNPPMKSVADDFGVSLATWSQWESGGRFPAPGLVQPLSEFLLRRTNSTS